MTKTTTVLVTAAVTTAGLLLTACGDDEASITRDEFLEQANAICQETNDELEPVFLGVWEGLDDVDLDDPANQNIVFVRFDEAMDTIGPAARQQLEDIRALGAPDGDDELIETLLTDYASAIDWMESTAEAAAAGDEAAMEAMDGTDDPFIDLDRRAREYGLTVCGDTAD